MSLAPHQSWIPTIALSALAAVAGVAVTSIGYEFSDWDKLSVANTQLKLALARNTTLEAVVRTQSEALAIPLVSTNAVANTPPINGYVDASVKLVSPLSKDAPAHRLPGATPNAKVASAVPTPKSSAPSAAAESTVESKPVPAPTGNIADSAAVDAKTEQIRAAIKTNSIEITSSTKLGISKLESDHVTMGSGLKVPVGGKFQSGEILLLVDPVNNKIITDRRTILLQ